MKIEKYNQSQEIHQDEKLTKNKQLSIDKRKPSIDTRERIKEELLRLKNDWSDEKPPRIVDGRDLEYKYNKYRKNWFAAVVLALDILAGESFLSKDSKEEIKNFEEYYTSNDFKERLTEKEDIEKADSLLIEKVLQGFQEIKEG